MQAHSLKIQRWIPKQLQRELYLTQYSTVIVKQQSTSKVLAKLKDFQYRSTFLKRVKKYQTEGSQQKLVEIILCNTQDQIREQIQKQIQNFIQEAPYIRKLPKYAPLTKEQYRQWSRLWPINFIQQQIAKQVQIPLYQQQFIEQLFYSQVNYPQDIYLFQTKNTLIQSIQLLSETGSCDDNSIDHPIMRLLEKWPMTQIFKSNCELEHDKSAYYYLTGLKLFTRKQMCGMCSMALVHSRLNQLYLEKETLTEQMDTIMSNPRLNHQVNIYTLDPHI